MHRRLLVATVIAVALGTAAGPVASATEPMRHTYEESGTVVDEAVCAFPVDVSWEYIGDEVHFYDRDGTMVKIDLKFMGRMSYAANGKTLGSDWAHSNITVFGPSSDSWADGGRYFTARTSGARFRLPDGSPTAFAHGGRLTIDSVTGEVTFTPGFVYPVDFTEVCAYLAP